MRLLTRAAAAALLLVTPLAAHADDATSSPDLGSDDPALQQRVSSDEAMGEGQVVIEQGHVDLGPRFVDGKWTFLARDDTAKLTGGKALWRQTDDVVLKVNDKAKLTLPEGDEYAFTGAKAGETVWAVPQTEVAGVVWLGWNTQDPEVVKSVDRGVTLRFVEAKHMDGDGRMTVFLQPGNFAPPQVLHDGTKPSEAWVDLNTHTHANWVFTKPGTWLVQLQMQAKGVDGKELTSEAVIRLSVGDSADPKAAFAAKWPGEEPDGSTSEGASATTGSQPATPAASATASGPEGTDDAPSGETEGGSALWMWLAGGGAVAVIGGGVAVAMRRRQKLIEQEVFDGE